MCQYCLRASRVVQAEIVMALSPDLGSEHRTEAVPQWLPVY